MERSLLLLISLLLFLDLTPPASMQMQLSLSSPNSAVSPGETVQLQCRGIYRKTISLYRDSTSISTKSARRQNYVTFSIKIRSSSDQGSYTCAIPSSTHSNSISITVVSLVQPSISVVAPDGGLFWGPGGPEVTRGHSLSILCSTEAQYPGGSFHLLLDANSKSTRTQSALNHSASFYIPEIDYSHQGNYSCVYQVTVSSRNFNSTQSEPLTLTVRASMAPIIGSGVACGLFILIVIPAVIYLAKRKCLSNQDSRHMTTSTPVVPGTVSTYHSRPGATQADDNIYMNTMQLDDNTHHCEAAESDLDDDYVNVDDDYENVDNLTGVGNDYGIYRAHY